MFVVSDFLEPPPRDLWLRTLARRWDLIPVVVQDPTLEQSFPSIEGIVLPFADPGTGRRAYAELSARQVAERRAANAARRASLVRVFRQLDLEPVLVDSAGTRAVLAAFLSWVDRRRSARGRTWHAA